MPFRLALDADSVLTTAACVRGVGARLDAAPGGAALRQIAVAVPGGELSRATCEEAAEWAGEMAEVGAVLERYAALLEAAVAGLRRADAAGAAALGR
ncbi:MAG: hypothetical protein WD794_09735 [Mycobacteriales bacterium]